MIVILVMAVVVDAFMGRALDLPRAFDSGRAMVAFGTDRVNPVLSSLLAVV